MKEQLIAFIHGYKLSKGFDFKNWRARCKNEFILFLQGYKRKVKNNSYLKMKTLNGSDLFFSYKATDFGKGRKSKKYFSRFSYKFFVNCRISKLIQKHGIPINFKGKMSIIFANGRNKDITSCSGLKTPTVIPNLNKNASQNDWKLNNSFTISSLLESKCVPKHSLKNILSDEKSQRLEESQISSSSLYRSTPYYSQFQSCSAPNRLTNQSNSYDLVSISNNYPSNYIFKPEPIYSTSNTPVMNRYPEQYIETGNFGQSVGEYPRVTNSNYSHQYQMQNHRYDSNYSAHYNLYKNCVNDLSKDYYFDLK